MADITLPVIVAAMSLASALAGYRAGKARRPADPTLELNKLGRSLRLPRHRGESNDDYAERLIQHMREEE